VVRWAAFAGLTVVSVSLFLALARASQAMMNGPDAANSNSFDSDDDLAGDDTEEPRTDTDVTPTDERFAPSAGIYSGSDGHESGPVPGDGHDIGTGNGQVNRTDDGDHFDSGNDVEGAPTPIDSLSTGALLLNVAFSQGVFGGLVLIGAWYTEVPLAALGVSEVGVSTLVLGVGAGTALYAGNELAAAGANALGFTPPENLRETLAPDSAAGWVLLLVVILPAIASVEELLFRAALIGALSAGFAVSPWALAVVSSIAFALGHGAQGSLGMVVTGSLGFLLAAIFVLTGSLLVVVVAHYLVNALEFVVHEGLGIEWSE